MGARRPGERVNDFERGIQRFLQAEPYSLAARVREHAHDILHAEPIRACKRGAARS